MQSPRSERPFFRNTRVIEVGALRLDPEGFAVSVGGQDLSLTFGEFLLLLEFARHPYQVLRRERLAALIRENIGGTDAPNTLPRSVDTHISRLRTKLRQAGYDCIKTMRFVGYRFVPNAEGELNP